MEDLAHALAVAADVVEAAGDLAREQFATSFSMSYKNDAGDLVTPVDVAAETLIVERLTREFPEHRVFAEERGFVGPENDYQWLVDPLDGTNNFAIGFPAYGVCVTLLHRGIPVVAAIRHSHTQQTFTAIRGEGAWRSDTPLRVANAQPPKYVTITAIRGWKGALDNADVWRMKADLSEEFKRVIPTWSPATDWGLLASGRIGAVGAFDWDEGMGEDIHGGVLIAREAGAVVVDLDENPMEDPVKAPVVVGEPETVARVCRIARKHLRH